MSFGLNFFQKNNLVILNTSRWMLILALAICGYLLLLAWQKDYGDTADTRSSPIQSEKTTQYQKDGLPTLVTQQPAIGHDDIPTLNLSNLTPTSETKQSVGEKQNIPSIEVQTDTLQITIDLQGGDVVQAALRTYPASLQESSEPFVLLKNDSSTYIAQSGVIGLSGLDFDQSNRPLYRAAKDKYVMQGDLLEVPLIYTLENGVEVKKLYRFHKGRYVVDVVYQMHNKGTTQWQGSFFGQLKRDNAIDANSKFSGFSLPTYLGAAYWKPDNAYNKLTFKQIAAGENRLVLDESIPGGWLAIVQHYFIAAWVPKSGATYRYTARTNQQGENIIGFTSPLVTITPGEQKEIGAELYVGPKLHNNLSELATGLDLAIDYGFLFFISHLLVNILTFLYGVLNNWGWSIVVLTCLVKIMFFYPSAISYRSMSKMRLVQPKMAKLKEQFGDDKQRFSQEMIKLYKAEKINPVSGCLPMLLQMPVFFALYWALMESVQLRHAPFIFWIKDLAAMDPYFVLPLIMGATMFIQMRLNPTPTDPLQAKVMNLMPIMFTGLFLFFPSGLVLYWITNNALSIAQQWMITRRLSAE